MKPNIISIRNVNDNKIVDIIMNSKEIQLFMDESKPEDSWALMCDSIEHREGIAIMDGNWELVSSRIMGIEKPLH